jgi:hypothetical protein
MWELLKRLWTDQAYFVSVCRMIAAGLGVALNQGIIPGGKIGWWIGALLIVLPFGVAAGEKNVPDNGPAHQ